MRNLLHSLLNLITPERIGELSTIETDIPRSKLTELMLSELKNKDNSITPVEQSENELEAVKLEPKVESESLISSPEDNAKILPFNSEESEVEIQGEHVKKVELKKSVEKKSLKMANGTEIFFDEEVEVTEEKVDTTQFILSEKEKFKKQAKRLKQLEVMDLYKKNASVDIEQERVNNDDLSKSANSGVLVNKKQL